MTIGSAPGFHHRSSLKQKNKPFKGTTKAKAAVSRGKIDHKTLVAPNNANLSLNGLSKADRKNQSKIRLLARKSALSDQKRIFTGPEGVARTIALIPLTPSANVQSVLEGLYGSVGRVLDVSQSLYVEAFKQNLRFFCPDRRNLLEVVDTAGAVDTIIFLVSARDECIDLLGVDLLEVLRAQGLCTAVACIQDLESSVPAKKQHDLRTNWLNSLSFHLASTLHGKLFSLDHFESRREAAEMLRILSQLHIYEGISWRNVHPYLVAETVECVDSSLKVTGRVRGDRPFSPNQLVHIPGIGDFKLKSISGLSKRTRQVEKNVFPEAEKQEQLFNFETEDLEDEEEKISFNASSEKTKEPLIVRVPKGTSLYQARIIHEAGLDYPISDEESVEDEDEKAVMKENEESIDSSSEDLTDIDINNDEEDEISNKDRAREEREAEEAIQDYAEIKRRQLEDAEPLSKYFPDAVEVPEDQPARQRFSKYRGVESLRTSEWDTSADKIPNYMENIFEFQNFKLSMKKALTYQGRDSDFANDNEMDDDVKDEVCSFGAGALIQLELSLDHLSPASEAAQSLFKILQRPTGKVPLCIYGLLAHEQKYSILNLNLQPRASSVPVRSKEPVLMIYGFRRLEVAPIYSDASHGQNLHTMHRLMPLDRPCTASVLAPITYPPTSVLFFRPTAENNRVSLIASGSLESIKPNRIVLKRITFIGYPFKIHRRTCTVRFMFFNPSDVNWFRPVELVTSIQNRRGHIKESLGTHGYMKCIFDKQIQQNEQIAMHLYKRIFPKWQTRICSTDNLVLQNDRPEDDSMQQ